MSTFQNAGAGVAPGRPSRTSILVAAARAFGAREPDESVRNPDMLAERLLGPEELAQIADHPVAQAYTGEYAAGRERVEVGMIANLMLVRTRWIDERVVRALDNGATQLVILGAGFDTRAWRFAEKLRGKRVFEVDFHSTQELKRRRATEALGGAPDNVAFVEIDFQQQKLGDVLRRAGWRPSEKTFFISEGVSMYIREEGVRETLRTVAESAAGSELVMDFAGQRMIEMIREYPAIPQNRFTSGWGEPWLFGIPDGAERGFFRECGLELVEIMSLFGKAARRYITRANGRRLGPARWRQRGQGGENPRPFGGFFQAMRVMIPAIVGTLAGKYKWYALAEVRVPEKAG